MVTLMPGQETGWHRQEVPLFGYILEGALTVDYGPAGSHTYEAGDAFLEAFGTTTAATPATPRCASSPSTWAPRACRTPSCAAIDPAHQSKPAERKEELRAYRRQDRRGRSVQPDQ